MAYFKNPDEDKVDSIEFYEDGIIGNAQLKTTQSKLICAPFNAPYQIYTTAPGGPGTTPGDMSLNPPGVMPEYIAQRAAAAKIAQYWGLSIQWLAALAGSPGLPMTTGYYNIYIPYDHAGLQPGLTLSYNGLQSESTNAIFNPAADSSTIDILRTYISIFVDDRFGDTPDHTIQFKTGTGALYSQAPGAMYNPDAEAAGFPPWSYGKPPTPIEKAAPPASSLKYYVEEALWIHADWITPQLNYNAEERLQAYKDAFDQIKKSFLETPHSFRDARFTISKSFAEVAYEAGLGEKTGMADPVRITPYYNYYLQPYEKITRDLKIISSRQAAFGGEIKLPEIMLPNIYGLVSDMIVDTSLPTNTYKYADQWQIPLMTTNLNAGWTEATIEGTTIAIPPAQTVKNAHPTINMFTADLLHLGEEGTGHAFYKSYFNNYATSTSDLLQQFAYPAWTRYHELSQKYYTTGISANYLKDLTKEADEFKNRFPMYVDVEIPAANSGKVGKILKKTNFFNEFMQTIMAAMQPRHSHANDSMQDYWQKTAIIKKDSFIKKDLKTVAGWKDSLYQSQLATFWLNEILQEPFFPNLGGGATAAELAYSPDNDNESLKKLNKKIDGPVIRPPIFGRESGTPLQFMNNIKWANARIKINTLIKEHVRSVKDIYNGKEAYSEVLFYEIVKFRYDSKTQLKGEFVQNIFLPNLSDMDTLKYIDTQVKYDEEYYYQIYAHTFVVGTQYEYVQAPHALPLYTQMSNPEAGPKEIHSHSHLMMKYKYAPTVYLIRVPYFNTWVTMHNALKFTSVVPQQNWWNAVQGLGAATQTAHPDNLEYTPIISKPPVFPDTTCLPLYGERNKVLINANFNVGEYEFEPITIDPGETGQINKLRKNQRKLTGPITFKSDDFCGQIEILRIDDKPFSYEDFAPTANSRIAIVGGSTGFGHIDNTLKPNKDYYYTLREKDVHENYSNPSPIYQVRIVAKVGEAPYTIIKMFFIEEVEEKQPTTLKKLMKYIRIQPSFEQSYLDDSGISSGAPPSAEDLIVNPGWLVSHIGDPDIAHPIWGRKFKFRFTSKKTGKKFDLNLTIDNPYAAPEENQASQGEQNILVPGKC